jgi:flavin-dependent dehydrogenase
MENHYDVIVIGAGPAGSIASAKLLKAGKRVLVLEKMNFPRFVIGESLLPHIMDYLKELDLLTVLEEQQFQIKDGVCFYHNNSNCPFSFDTQYTENAWKYTWQVKRADFDHTLIKEVERRGATVVFQAQVDAVETSKTIQHVHYSLVDGTSHTATANFLIDASGYGRVLPRLKQLEIPVDTPPRGAIFVHIKDKNRTEEAGKNIFVHVFRNNTAWFWSIPFSDGTTSVGVVSNVDFIEDCAKNNGEEFIKLIEEFPGLEGRFKNVERVFEPKTVMNYAVSVSKLHDDGYVLAGNATEFLDPTFSSGVLFAVVSGYKAAETAIKQLNGEAVDWELEYSNPIKDGINVFRTYVHAWYDGRLATIFFAKERNELIMKQICSVLAGYVWDLSNPFVKKHNTVVTTLAKVIQMKDDTAE